MIIQFLRNKNKEGIEDELSISMLVDHLCIEKAHEEIPYNSFADHRGVALWAYSQQTGIPFNEFEFRESNNPDKHLDLGEQILLQKLFKYMQNPIYLKERLQPKKIEISNNKNDKNEKV